MSDAASMLKLNVRDGFGVAVLHIGKITGHEAETISGELKQAAEASSSRLILDMRHVMMIASAALGSLISTQKQCAAAGGTLTLVELSPDLKQLLKITNLHKVIPVADDMASAEARVLKGA